jgi:GTPase SAR1 family protein
MFKLINLGLWGQVDLQCTTKCGSSLVPSLPLNELVKTLGINYISMGRHKFSPQGSYIIVCISVGSDQSMSCTPHWIVEQATHFPTFLTLQHLMNNIPTKKKKHKHNFKQHKWKWIVYATQNSTFTSPNKKLMTNTNAKIETCQWCEIHNCW